MKEKIAIGIPHTDSMPSQFVNSLLSLIERLDKDPNIELNYLLSDLKPLESNRTRIVAELLQGNPDWILFIDSDQAFGNDLYYKLRRHDKDLVSAMVVQKAFPYRVCIKLLDDETGKYSPVDENEAYVEKVMKGELFEVAACGMGALLVRASVFEKLVEPWFEFIDNGLRKGKGGEDIYFTSKCRKAGFKVYADASTWVRHIGGIGLGMESWVYGVEALRKSRSGEPAFKEFVEELRKK